MQLTPNKIIRFSKSLDFCTLPSVVNNIKIYMLGFWQLVALVVGNLVGSGVLMLPAILAPYGSISFAGWVAASFGAILLSLVFCQLCSKHPRTGGPHVYVEEAFGKNAGFYIAWVYWILAWIGYAALVSAAMGCLTTVCGPLSKPALMGIEVLIIVVFTAVNLCQISFAGRVELVLTFVKVLPLIILPLIALFSVKSECLFATPCIDKPYVSSMASAVLLMIFAFMGFETATVPSEEVENPRKTIPKATIVGTLIAAGIYILGTVSMLGHIPCDVLANSKAPYADLAASIFGGNWQNFIAGAGILCALGALNGWMLIGGRIAYGAAQDGIFPKIFLKKDKYGAPSAAIIISSMCTIPFMMLSLSESLVEQFNFVVSISSSLVLIVYLACTLAYLKFLKDYAHSKPKHWLLGIASTMFCLWVLSSINLEMTLYSLTVFLVGIPLREYVKRRT